jgi:hypothetical protein
MTSIGSTSSQAFSSPLDRLKNELSTEVQAGTVKSADQDALSNALDSIDSSLQADRASQSQGSRPDPSELGKKIDDLISQQVEAGTLTSDQASELQGLFKNADPGEGGPGGPGGPPPGGPPPGGPPPGGSGGPQQSGSSTESSDSSDSKSVLEEFLASLQSQLAQGQNYGSNGSSTSTASTTSLLLNFQV